jgi:hypothetical protein
MRLTMARSRQATAAARALRRRARAARAPAEPEGVRHLLRGRFELGLGALGAVGRISPAG